MAAARSLIWATLQFSGDSSRVFWSLGPELFARELETGRPLPGAEQGLDAAMDGMDAAQRANDRPGNALEPPGAAGAEGGT